MSDYIQFSNSWIDSEQVTYNGYTYTGTTTTVTNGYDYRWVEPSYHGGRSGEYSSSVAEWMFESPLKLNKNTRTI